MAASTHEQPVDLEDTRPKFEDCCVNHTCSILCSSIEDLPSRLLDVGNQGADNTIKLIETSTANITDYKYAALSYCWGYSTPFITEPSSLKCRLEGFSLSEMPLTLRETIWVVRALGIQYLWIDALCIIQEPRDFPHNVQERELARVDWKQESACMDKVYGNAFLTIVAAGASDSQQGLINPKLSFPLNSRSKSSKSATIVLNSPGANSKAKQKTMAIDALKVAIHDEPISSRGWALQEWLLSPRLLVFTTTGPHFICNEYKMLTYHASSKYRLPRPPSMPTLTDWQMIVMNFSPRNLTNPNDKLPALSGLAKTFFALRNGTCGDYLAGLWKASLLSDLTWKRNNHHVWRPVSTREGRCPGRAPSWSWAAIDGPIGFNDLEETESIDVEVKDCYTKPATGYDCFGEVESGVLVIHCPYKEALISPRFPSLCDDDGVDFASFFEDDPSELDQLTTESRSDEGSKLYCLRIRGSKAEWVGIVVRMDKSKVCTRVGYFITIHGHGFEASNRMDFEII